MQDCIWSNISLIGRVTHIQGILTTCLNAFLPPFVSWKMWLLKDRFPRNILQRLSDRILKTARALKDIMPEFEWKVFGDINPNFIERVFGIKHEEVNVRLMGVGSAEQIKEALLSATAYVHPSYIDNASNSLCEALMSGVPAVSTYTGGLPSVIDDGKTGFLVPTNDPFQMAYMMKWLHENEQDNIIMGQRAREAALMRHDRAQIVDTVLSVYDEILNGNR